MRNIEFQEAIDEELKRIIKPLIKEYPKYKVEFDNVRHNAYLTIKTKQSMLKIALYQSGDISYFMWDSLGIGGKELFYYKYDIDAKQDEIIKKFKKDFKTFLAMYFENPSIHDLTGLVIAYNSDNKEAFAEYKEISAIN